MFMMVVEAKFKRLLTHYSTSTQHHCSTDIETNGEAASRALTLKLKKQSETFSETVFFPYFF